MNTRSRCSKILLSTAAIAALLMLSVCSLRSTRPGTSETQAASSSTVLPSPEETRTTGKSTADSKAQETVTPPAQADPAAAEPDAGHASPTATTIAPENSLSESALRQIAALQREKAERTPVQRKIDSQLLAADKMRQGLPIAEGVTNLLVELDRDAAGRVLVDITASVSEPLLGVIKELGGEVISSFPQYKAIRAAVPLAQIETLAAQAGVVFVQPAVRATVNVGSVTSEGDRTHRADNARTTYSVDGSGVRVGVLSDSVDYLANSQANGDLGTVTVLPGQAGTGMGEGTAMLEIVHDLAPGAELFFASGFGSVAAFADNIRKLRAAGCDIIVDDITYHNESPFQDGIIAQAVNDVSADGALVFSSAANSGHLTRNESGTWEGDFADGGALTTPLQGGGSFHRFGSVNYNTVTAAGGGAFLFWANPLGGATDDYDLYILDSSGTTVLAKSDTTQNGTQDPYEQLVGNLSAGLRIVVVHYSGDARFLHLASGRGRLAVGTSGSTRGHNAAASIVDVAAVDVATSYPEAFMGGAKNPVTSYSSDGPRRMFFHSDGTAITPGNFSATGGTVLQKPDIAAAAGGLTSVLIPDQPADQQPFAPFHGTSAAAPHAAAIAALLKSYNPALTAAQIRDALIQTALDIEAPGVDRDSGHGLIMPEAALQSLQAPVSPTITSFAPTNGAVGTDVMITGTKFEQVSAVKFNGVNATFTVNSGTQISAKVPASAGTGRIAVTTSGGTATSADDFAVLSATAITSFTPASGAVGSTIVISGAGFSGATLVKFNGISATFTVDSATRITATVPAGATTGRISVTAPAGTATSSSNFTVTSLPILTGFSPANGGIGSPVTLAGANLAGATSVTFSGVSADFTVNSATQITATVPAGATTGPITVTTPGGTITSASSFTVITGPAITSITPSSGPIGTEISIAGQNLNGALSVRFNGVEALNFLVQSGSHILSVVPPGATTGPVSVITPGGTATSPTAFAVVSRPANDDFADAQGLTGESGTFSGINNVGATKEPGEPHHAGNEGGRSLWYRWMAPANGSVRFDTASSDFDTLLAVYTGAAVSNLTLVAQSDDVSESNRTSAVTFLANAGTAYQVAVDGHTFGVGGPTNIATGSVVLHWSSAASVPVITGFSPTSGSAGTPVVLAGVNLNEATAVRFGGVNASFTVDSSVQITATVPPAAVSGVITVRTPTGTAASTAAFSVIGIVNNDNFADAQSIAGATGSILGNNEFASSEPGEPKHAGAASGRSVWYRWTAPSDGHWIFDTTGSDFDTLLASYTGSSVDALSELASNDDVAGARTSAVDFDATPGMTCFVAVDGYGGAGGNIVLNWRPAPSLPRITGFNPPGGTPGTPVTIQGVNFSGASSVRFNDAEASFTLESDARITATVPAAAETGPVRVITPGGRADSITVFTVTSIAPNDQFANAQLLGGSMAIAAGSTTSATREPGEPFHAFDMGGHSIWYRWAAPSDGVWTVDLSGSGFDTLLAIYSGSSLGGLMPVASNDDAGDQLTSRASFTANGGVTYHIAVDGYGGASGKVALRLFPDMSGGLVYATGFELWDGFWSTALAGYGGWTSLGAGGNGVVYGYLPGYGQNAYIGYGPAPLPGDALYVWCPIDYTPDVATLPVVRFSVVMSIVDSTNLEYDDFDWQVHNQSGDRLFTLDFDNSNLNIYYRLSGSSPYVNTGFTFENGVTYRLTMVMDFGVNRWAAFLNGTQIVNDQPISVGGLSLALGDIDAVWNPGDAAGDNFMLFDEYMITAEPRRAPVVLLQPQDQAVGLGGTATFGVIVRGEEPLEYQWQFENAPIPGGNGPMLTLHGITAAQAGSYSVVARNSAGSITSDIARLIVSRPPNLVPCQPAGWSAPLVVSTVANTTTDASRFITGQTLYLDWAVDNDSDSAITNRFFLRLYVDNEFRQEWSSDGLAAHHYAFVTDFDLGTLSAGGHTLRLEADATGAVAEANESDNAFSKTIVVLPATSEAPQLTGMTMPSTGSFEFSLSGQEGSTYAIQASPNLEDWVTLTNVTCAGTAVLVRDPDVPASSQRFYRALLVSPSPAPE